MRVIRRPSVKVVIDTPTLRLERARHDLFERRERVLVPGLLGR